MKVSELTGALLDYWVARASPQFEGIAFEAREGHIVGLADIDGEKAVCAFIHGGNVLATMRLRRKYQMDSAICYSPSKDWAQGGPIIEREFIAVFRGDGEWGAEVRHEESPHWIDTSVYHEVTGPTPLVAAMRAYVASKFGGEVSNEEAA